MSDKFQDKPSKVIPHESDIDNEDFGLETKSAPKLRTPISKIKGTPKSGKGWKQNSNKSHKSSINCNKALQSSWDEKMRRKAVQKKIVDINKKMKDEKVKKIKAEVERLKQKAKRKELNTFKSASFQLIKNTKKVKKWSRKARSELTKLPTEMFENIVRKEYNY